MQPRCEVADVLRHVSTDTFTIHQQKTLRAIAQCRTLALGGHVDVCDECGVIHISYNSCRNRHCPKCQGHKREECLPDWSFRRGFKNVNRIYCPALTIMWCSHCLSS
ncbi:MAG TPA: transposase zinc-binding domain-containing protein [Hanamia sp.]